MTLKPRLVERPPDEDQNRHDADLELVRAILDGSEEAWHGFIDRYSGLLMAVIHRYVSSRSDDARSLYADVLESLYRGKLATYAGRSALSTWLVLVTRSAVVDHLRHRLGGRELRDVLKALDPFQRQVFRHYYVEGLSFGTVLRLVRDHGAVVTPDRLLQALQQIEDRVHGRLARRMRYDLHAQSVGGASGRLLEYLDHVRSEFEDQSGTQSPDYYILEREARRTVEDVMTQVERLPAEERRLLSLRFEQGWTAKRIAEELGLHDQRSVYTVIERVLRALRRILNAPGQAARTRRPRAPDATSRATPAVAIATETLHE